MAAKDLKYQLIMESPHTHLIDVQLEFTGAEGEYIDLFMPVWTPGSYLIREYSRNIIQLSAHHKKESLQVIKTNKNTWRVYLENQKKVTVNYQVYANDLTVRTSFVDDEFAYLNGASIFIVPEDYINLPIRVRIEPFYKWNKTTTELPKYKGSYNEFTAADFDQLIDSPVVIGNHQTYDFTASGNPHSFTVIGTGNYDMPKIINDTQKIIETANDIFNDVPYDHYTFFLTTADGAYGGLEHKTSCSLIFDRWKFIERNDYLRFLGLVSHEFFHVYNVKRIRPEELGPFNYNQENYTTLLWVSEGLNSYYDNYLLRRADLATTEEYLKLIADDIKKLDGIPGRKIQSVSQSSFDAWIKLYRPDENSINSTVSYYLKGSLIGMILDLRIREITNGEKNIDDIFRLLWKDFRSKGDGFTEDNFITYSEQICGESLSDIWNYIHSTDDLNYNRYLQPFGLKLKKTNSDEDAGKNAWFGMSLNDQIKITKLRSDGPAYRDGLNVGDELISLNNYRLTEKNYRELLNRSEKSQASEITISRRGIIKKILVTPQDKPFEDYEIVQIENADSRAMFLYENWLYCDWNFEKEKNNTKSNGN